LQKPERDNRTDPLGRENREIKLLLLKAERPKEKRVKISCAKNSPIMRDGIIWKMNIHSSGI
jgi:hypothetical protein